MISRIKFWLTLNRLGPDMPLTHFLLYFKRTQRMICEAAFQSFGAMSEFRPGAYAISCGNIAIGKNVTIRPGTMLFAVNNNSKMTQITIQNDVLIGSGVHIYVSNHNFSNPNCSISKQGHSPIKTVTLEEGCWIGANVVILPGVKVGRNSVVGAGSVVTKSIPAHTVAVGNPAKIIKTVEMLVV